MTQTTELSLTDLTLSSVGPTVRIDLGERAVILLPADEARELAAFILEAVGE